MARCKLTARKMTGPRGVPRHQLAPRAGEGGASGSRPPRRSSEELEAEVGRLQDLVRQWEEEYRVARLNHYRDVRTNRDLRREIDRLTKQRDEAWDREETIMDRMLEAEQRVGQLELYNNVLHEEVHELYGELHPIPAPQEEDPELGVVLGQEDEDVEDVDVEVEPVEVVEVDAEEDFEEIDEDSDASGASGIDED